MLFHEKKILYKIRQRVQKQRNHFKRINRGFKNVILFQIIIQKQ